MLTDAQISKPLSGRTAFRCLIACASFVLWCGSVGFAPRNSSVAFVPVPDGGSGLFEVFGSALFTSMTEPIGIHFPVLLESGRTTNATELGWSPPTELDSSILRRVLMPVFAMGGRLLMHPSPSILGAGNGLKMIWIAAGCITAEVIQCQSFRDWAREKLISSPVNRDELAIFLYSGVSAPLEFQGPVPAPSNGVYFYPVEYELLVNEVGYGHSFVVKCAANIRQIC